MRGPSLRPLPDTFPAGEFLAADALASGISARRLRGRDLDRTYSGLRSTTTLRTVEDRCRLIRLRMPETAFFSHSTAALLLGIPVPWRLESDPDVHISFPRPARAPHANGVRGHRSSAQDAEIIELRSLRVTSPARTWSDLAVQVPLLDLVAAGDSIVHHGHPLASLEDLAEAIRVRTDRRHLKRLHLAFPLLDGRAESPPESVLRALMVMAGFGEPVVNRDVSDQFGEFVARTDLRFERHRLVLEYQGDYHRTTKGQWRADMSRRSKLEALGWIVMEVNADDLADPAELIARIRMRLSHRR